MTKPLFGVINKIDTPKSGAVTADFYKFMPTSFYPISAEHGLGVLNSLDALYPLLPSTEESDELQQLPRVAIVGRPNVGKIHVCERPARGERVVVSNVPGTTRDPVDSLVTHQDQSYAH